MTRQAAQGTRAGQGGLVLIDGHCLLCQASVRFLLPRDSHARLRFAPLQSEAAAAAIRAAGAGGVGVGSITDAGAMAAAGRHATKSGGGAPGSDGTTSGVTAAVSGAGRIPETVLFLQNDRLYARSDAALRILGELDAPWSALRVLLLVPRPIRDWVYDLVARKRYRWFGRSETCMVPPVDHDDRFLGGPHHPETGPNP